MTLLLSSVLLGLMWFAATNAVASLLAWLVGRSVMSRMARAPKRQSVQLLLAIRLLPAAASSLFVLAVFLPAHWSFEPPDTEESFGVVLAGTATLGLLLILHAGWRAIRAGFAGHRFAEIARRAARQVDPDGVDHQVLELKGLRGISLAGIWQPKIFIGPEALAALTPTELDLAIAHEIAHRRSNDNLKRFAMCCAPDFFGWTSVARRLEQQWQAEAECDADAHAVRGDDGRAIALASALVKVARLERVGGLRASVTSLQRVSCSDPARTAGAATGRGFGLAFGRARVDVAAGHDRKPRACRRTLVYRFFPRSPCGNRGSHRQPAVGRCRRGFPRLLSRPNRTSQPSNT